MWYIYSVKKGLLFSEILITGDGFYMVKTKCEKIGKRGAAL